MIYTSGYILKKSKEIGVKIEIYEHPNITAYISFLITGDPENRKTMIEFLEGWRPLGFKFEYNELDEG
jgi:hypothetical protein